MISLEIRARNKVSVHDGHDVQETAPGNRVEIDGFTVFVRGWEEMTIKPHPSLSLTTKSRCGSWIVMVGGGVSGLQTQQFLWFQLLICAPVKSLIGWGGEWGPPPNLQEKLKGRFWTVKMLAQPWGGATLVQLSISEANRDPGHWWGRGRYHPPSWNSFIL